MKKLPVTGIPDHDGRWGGHGVGGGRRGDSIITRVRVIFSNDTLSGGGLTNRDSIVQLAHTTKIVAARLTRVEY